MCTEYLVGVAVCHDLHESCDFPHCVGFPKPPELEMPCLDAKSFILGLELPEPDGADFR